ncbi:MAG: EAL domain-containing protein, partial [bacterium]
ALDRYEIAPSLLDIEITEGVFIQNLDDTLKILNTFKEKGIKISIDDFGTGYSSLSYIKNIPADFIKIDISFISGMIENIKDTAIVNTVVVLASKLGMNTIAEGVETEEQLEILKSFGCDMVQGYLFSKPLPEDEILQFLK